MTHPLKLAKSTLLSLALFSAVVNLLMLSGAIYMLQVYDRVVPSQSIPTLVAMTLLVAFLFLAMGWLEHVRSRVLVRIGAKFRARAEQPTMAVMSEWKQQNAQGAERVNGLREVEQIKNALGSPAMSALFDLPWVPIYFIALFALHSWAGLYAIVSAILILILAFISHAMTKKCAENSGESQATANRIESTYFSGLSNIKPLGMRARFVKRIASTRVNKPLKKR